MLTASIFQHRLLRWLAVFLMVWSTISVPSASAQRYDDRDPAYAEFYPALDPHGDWVEHPRHGMTWVPHANEERDWRPYSRGQWIYTEEHGWYWESEEPFGWVVYHYGRWLLDERNGWMWVPGREWAPAWVAWRQGEETVGWAPLPPEAGIVDDGEVSFAFYDSPRYAPMWMFVAPAALLLPAVWRHAYPRGRNTMFFGRTQFVTHYGYRNRQIYNRGIDRRFIEMRTQRPVPVLQVRPLPGARDMMRRGPIEGQRHVNIYRPHIQPPAPHQPGRGGERWQRPSPGVAPVPMPAPGPIPRSEPPRPGPARGIDGRPGFEVPPPRPNIEPRPNMEERRRLFGDRDHVGRPPQPQPNMQPHAGPRPPSPAEARPPMPQPRPQVQAAPPQPRPQVQAPPPPHAPPPAARPAPPRQPQHQQPGQSPMDLWRNR